MFVFVLVADIRILGHGQPGHGPLELFLWKKLDGGYDTYGV